jgi:hypothetical protein
MNADDGGQGAALEQLDGAESGRRTSFGKAPGNSIPEEWVEELLWRLYAADPQGFGIILMDLYRERRLDDVALSVTRTRKSRSE